MKCPGCSKELTTAGDFYIKETVLYGVKGDKTDGFYVRGDKPEVSDTNAHCEHCQTEIPWDEFEAEIGGLDWC